VKLVNRESLLHEKEVKKNAEEAKAAEKESKKAEQAERDAQRKINPREMFLLETDKYSRFDDKVWNFVLVGVIYNLCSILVIPATVFT
jgi:cysteinyl-tRNA synthetase